MKGPLALTVTLAAGAAACARTTPVGGLLVTMNVDDTFENVAPTRLDLAVRAPTEGGATYRDATYTIPGDTSLPATLVIESNGAPDASVEIDVALWQGTRPIDARRYRVEAIPTDHFAPFTIDFSATCTSFVQAEDNAAVSTCPPGTTCDPSLTAGDPCASDVIVIGSDASASVTPPFEAGPGADDAESAMDASDATIGDASAPSDASIACAAGEAGCDDAAPECPTPCMPGATYCFKGRCVPVPPSCLGNTAPVCTSYEVPGGPFDRSYDGVTYADAGAPAIISGFRLDAYEVTVARFSNFVTAVVLGTGLPEAGAGRHVHLYGGRGLVAVGSDADGGDAGPDSEGGASYETGWDPAWNANLATTPAAWDANLTSFVSSTWYPPNQAANADLPINAVTWYEAYAFCIWDGGFLPSEAEWNYAASGGGEQRVYPWGITDPGTASEYAIYGCYYGGDSPGNCSFTYNIAPVGSAPMGEGKFGQSDLAGNMWEWTLDGYAPYVTPCQDCAALGGSTRVFRGGTYYQVAEYLAASSRQSGAAGTRFAGVGFRCARTP